LTRGAPRGHTTGEIGAPADRPMTKINGGEIRPGMVIEHDGSLWVAVKTMAVKPGKGPAYNQVELKNIIDATASSTSASAATRGSSRRTSSARTSSSSIARASGS
jgi:Elongation factor P (EF-P) KOW-like domain